jgi:hypothetical protein
MEARFMVTGKALQCRCSLDSARMAERLFGSLSSNGQPLVSRRPKQLKRPSALSFEQLQRCHERLGRLDLSLIFVHKHRVTNFRSKRFIQTYGLMLSSSHRTPATSSALDRNGGRCVYFEFYLKFLLRNDSLSFVF